MRDLLWEKLDIVSFLPVRMASDQNPALEIDQRLWLFFIPHFLTNLAIIVCV